MELQKYLYYHLGKSINRNRNKPNTLNNKRSRIIEQTKFCYSPLWKPFGTQTRY